MRDDIRLTVRRADGFFARLKGLMFKSSLEAGVALWIDPCRGIHTFFMKFSIDVIFLSRDLRVVGLHPAAAPNRFGPYCWAARSVLECRAGFIEESGVRIGQRWILEGSEDAGPAALKLCAPDD